MNLTEHFTLEEMLRSETAEKKKIENRINAEEVNNLHKLCQKVLEPLRAHFGKPSYYAFLRDNVKTTELINEGNWIHVAL